jgi:hypothetical protein
MNVGYPGAIEVAKERDLFQQALGIGIDRRTFAHSAGIASAVETKFGTERHVNI